MIPIEHRKRIHLMMRAAGCLTTIALLYSPLPSFWSSVAWGQQSPTQLNSSVQAQAELRRRDLPILPSHHMWNHQHRMQRPSLYLQPIPHRPSGAS
jgi:hypothetical protein